MLRKFVALLLSTALVLTALSCDSKNMKINNQLFYRPSEGVLGDVIPYYEDGKYYLYYLHDPYDGNGVNWNLVTTTDFVSYEEHGVVIQRGYTNEQDFCAFTGSVIKKDNKYHIFYTGANGAFTNQNGKKAQAIMHAVGDSPYNFTKMPQDTFYASSEYEKNDWRDPFVYFDNKDNMYKMLITARKNDETIPSNNRGVVAVYSSKDLTNWIDDGIIWQPNQYFAHECPDLFKIGDWWYLVYSEFSTKISTKYVMSKDLKNWIVPTKDYFDARGFYAAKTAGHDNQRYIFGWNPIKDNNVDDGGWLWGGNLVAHQLVQNMDGTLSVKIPDTLYQAFQKPTKSIKNVEITNNTIAYKSIYQPKSSRFMIECKIKGNADYIGLTIAKGDTNYKYAFNYLSNTFEFDSKPDKNNFEDIKSSFNFEKGKEYNLKILVDGEVAVAYLDNSLALSTRIYKEYTPLLELFVDNGSANASDIKIYEF